MSYQRIKPFDCAIFQIAKTGELHAVGVVRETFYDDQTPIWPEEIQTKRVQWPWRVSFCFMLFSEEPIMTRFIKSGDYIDKYGLGTVAAQDLGDLFMAVEKKSSLKIKAEL